MSCTCPCFIRLSRYVSNVKLRLENTTTGEKLKVERSMKSLEEWYADDVLKFAKLPMFSECGGSVRFRRTLYRNSTFLRKRWFSCVNNESVLKGVFRQIRCVKWLDVMYVDNVHNRFSVQSHFKHYTQYGSNVILSCFSVYFHSVNIPNSLQMWLSLPFFSTHFALFCQYICHDWFSWLAFVQHVSKMLFLP